jgi:hypothetical protein
LIEKLTEVWDLSIFHIVASCAFTENVLNAVIATAKTIVLIFETIVLIF